MKTRRFPLLIVSTLFCFTLFVLTCRAVDATVGNLAEAEKRVQQQGFGDETSDYELKFTASISDQLAKAIKEGSASKGKSSFDVLCVVAGDGRISNTFLIEPTKQPLGEYVAPKLIGLQAAKPPKSNWVVYLAMQPATPH